jgi:hypothetical protein
MTARSLILAAAIAGLSTAGWMLLASPASETAPASVVSDAAPPALAPRCEDACEHAPAAPPAEAERAATPAPDETVTVEAPAAPVTVAPPSGLTPADCYPWMLLPDGSLYMEKMVTLEYADGRRVQQLARMRATPHQRPMPLQQFEPEAGTTVGR